MKKHDWFVNNWVFEIRSPEGLVLFSEQGRNALCDEGEEWMLRAAFRKDYISDVLYARLCNQVLSETSSLADITTEPSGNGYSAQLIERSSVGFPTIEQVGGDSQLTSKTVTWTAAVGSIGPVSTIFLATSTDSTGKLILYKALPITQTILATNSGFAYFKLKLS